MKDQIVFTGIFSVVTLLANLAQAAPVEPAHGTFAVQQLVGSYQVTKMIVDDVYSSGSDEKDMTEYWLSAVLNAKVGSSGLVLKNSKGGDGLDAEFGNLNGGEASSSPSGSGLTADEKSQSYTTAQGVFYRQTMSIAGLPGVPNSAHSYYQSVRLSVLSNGDLELVKYQEDCPAASVAGDGTCGPISQGDVYSSSKKYSAILHRK